ncbi:MAG: hypothetical protein MUP19_03265, partial [Candidatus Aminicenantes bacterium]|nr:hypothetical protein [Candidatus Aminicenantes bacterium]
VNVTLNDPLVYATKANAILGAATMQTVVEGRDLSDKKTTKIEEFLEDIYYMVDEYLVKREIPGLDAFINEQINIRGRIAAKSCVRIEGEELIPDVLPLDTRHFATDVDHKGIVWGAPDYRRTKTQIEREYPTAKVKDAGTVVDYWDTQKNIVFIDTNQVESNPNRYGYPPFIYVTCPIGSMLNTEAAAKHKGESIFWADRDLWPQMNMLVSILQTLTHSSLFAALQRESSHPETMGKPDKSPYKPRTVHDVEKGMGYKAMPINDIKVATNLAYSILEARVQRGSLSAIDYGTLTFPLSAVALKRLSGSRDDIFMPRIQAKALFYQALSRMTITQCIQLGQAINIGEPGSQNTYSPSDLAGDYTIKYRFFTESTEDMVANLSIANASRGIMSEDTIRREVLKLKDPDGERVKIESEQAEKVDEVLFLFRRAYSLVDKDKPTEQEMMESKILVERAKTVLQQRRAMGQLSPIEGQKTPQPQGQKGKELLPLLGGGGQGRPVQEPQTQEVTNG